jgi:predicted Rossmann fold flavoprotein
MSRSDIADVVIVGGGAAGLAAAIFCARTLAGRRVLCVDGARSIGAKILVSGGGRCNVTNRTVRETDFWGGDRLLIRNVLRAYPAERAAVFFEELGVRLHTEDDGKLFPDSNRARTVLDALVRGVNDAGAELQVSRRVEAVARTDGGFLVRSTDGDAVETGILVLATGGRSMPKTGSDGHGYALARGLGHGYVATTPALAPLILGDSWHAALAGASHPAAVTVQAEDAAPVRLIGAMLWTHFGVSGPVVLNASRHWLRPRLHGQRVDLRLNVLPGSRFPDLDAWLQEQQRSHPRALVKTVIASRLPASVASVFCDAANLDSTIAMAHLTRDDRRRLITTLLEMPLDVVDSRGYNYAEVTAGGIPLSEIDSATMESRVCSRLFLIGEMLDVDGRIGGFNFQWAWSSAWVAASAIARMLRA